jgi:hypothetical protein
LSKSSFQSATGAVDHPVSVNVTDWPAATFGIVAG